VRAFDRTFGADFLAGVPTAPGVYRFHDAAGGLLYVGKAANLRRRLAQYRLAGRRKKERKRRTLVRATARITWEVCGSPLAAALAEIRLIQTLRPPRNVASAYPFLYPFVGLHVEGDETYFCLTTSPEAFPAIAFHGAFRSREITREAFLPPGGAAPLRGSPGAAPPVPAARRGPPLGGARLPPPPRGQRGGVGRAPARRVARGARGPGAAPGRPCGRAGPARRDPRGAPVHRAILRRGGPAPWPGCARPPGSPPTPCRSWLATSSSPRPGCSRSRPSPPPTDVPCQRSGSSV